MVKPRHSIYGRPDCSFKFRHIRTARLRSTSVRANEGSLSLQRHWQWYIRGAMLEAPEFERAVGSI